MTARGMNDDEKQSVHAEFDRLVNMTPARLKAWLDSEESRSVGMTAGGEKVTGSGGAAAAGAASSRGIVRTPASAAPAIARRPAGRSWDIEPPGSEGTPAHGDGAGGREGGSDGARVA